MLVKKEVFHQTVAYLWTLSLHLQRVAAAVHDPSDKEVHEELIKNVKLARQVMSDIALCTSEDEVVIRGATVLSSGNVERNDDGRAL